MLAFEETSHATTATVVIESSSFDEKEVLSTQKPRIVDSVAFKTNFAN